MLESIIHSLLDASHTTTWKKANRNTNSNIFSGVFLSRQRSKTASRKRTRRVTRKEKEIEQKKNRERGREIEKEGTKREAMKHTTLITRFLLTNIPYYYTMSSFITIVSDFPLFALATTELRRAVMHVV